MAVVAAGIAGYLLIVAAGHALLAYLPDTAALPAGERLALDFALGAGLCSLLLFVGSLLTPGAAGMAWVIVPTLLLSAARLPRPWAVLREARATLAAARAAARKLDGWSIAAALVLGYEIAGNAASTFLAGLDWDSLAIWGLKARVAFLSGGVSLTYLTDPSRQWSHLDYPWLLPLNESLFFLLAGHTSIVLTKLVLPGFYACLLGLTYFGLRRRCPRPLCLVGAALVGALPDLLNWSATGFADSVVLLYWTGSVLYLSLWLERGVARDLVVAVALVACAAWTKNEGILYWAIQGGALLLAPLLGRPRREALRAWLLFALASLALVAPWALLKRRLQIAHNDFFPFTLRATLDHLDRLPVIAQWLGHELLSTAHWGLLWPVFAVALVPLALGGDAPRRYLAACVVTPLLLLPLSYLYSRWEPFTSHLLTSLDRLVLQQAALAVIAVGLLVGELARRRGAEPATAPAVAPAGRWGVAAGLAAGAAVMLWSGLLPLSAKGGRIAWQPAPRSASQAAAPTATPTPLSTADCAATRAQVARWGFDPYALLAANRPDVLRFYAANGWNPARQCVAIYDNWLRRPDGQAATTAVQYVERQQWATGDATVTPTPAPAPRAEAAARSAPPSRQPSD